MSPNGAYYSPLDPNAGLCRPNQRFARLPRPFVHTHKFSVNDRLSASLTCQTRALAPLARGKRRLFQPQSRAGEGARPGRRAYSWNALGWTLYEAGCCHGTLSVLVLDVDSSDVLCFSAKPRKIRPGRAGPDFPRGRRRRRSRQPPRSAVGRRRRARPPRRTLAREPCA
ncbi:hypothetical protein MPC1_2260002 [Methylocella tundrae]|nr:hypothetical protein MPC1_2260002 [Methylocella tundrae]